jgi:hypothetical protein
VFEWVVGTGEVQVSHDNSFSGLKLLLGASIPPKFSG